MQLSSFTDYALRVLLHAAARPGQRCLTGDVAAVFQVSRHHLVKVVNRLQRLGYLDTTRGRDGGFTLARPPQQIGLGDVVRRTEGPLALVECFVPATNTCPLSSACGLKKALHEARDAFFAVLDGYTLADLIAEPRWLTRLTTLVPPVRTGQRGRTILQLQGARAR